MATNQNVNKVVYGNQVVMDITDSTVDENNLLSGYKAYGADGEQVTGLMPNRGAVSPSGLNCGGSYTIPEGYHNGQGVVTANSLASQTGVDSGKTAVGAGQMVSGYQGWVNGSKVSGTMENKGAWTPSNINPGGSVTIPAGYHNGSGKVTANANQNSGTKTITSSDANWLTGNVDMGANNTYRYVNAVNVYNKGKADGATKYNKIMWASASGSDQVPGGYSRERCIDVQYSYNDGSGTSSRWGHKFNNYDTTKTYLGIITATDAESIQIPFDTSKAPIIRTGGTLLSYKYLGNMCCVITFKVTNTNSTVIDFNTNAFSGSYCEPMVVVEIG